MAEMVRTRWPWRPPIVRDAPQASPATPQDRPAAAAPNAEDEAAAQPAEGATPPEEAMPEAPCCDARLRIDPF